MALVPSAISGGLSLIGGLMGNSAKAKEAAKDRAFQLQMAQNAHQYEVEDLRKAGLNPILSGTGGPGARASGGSRADQSDVVTPAVNSALSAARMAQELDNLKAAEAKTREETDNIRVDTMNKNQEFNQRAFQLIEMNPTLLAEAKQRVANLGEEQERIISAKLLQLEQAKQAGNNARLLAVEADIQEWMQKHGMQEIMKSIGVGESFAGALRAILQLMRTKP